MFGWYPGHRTVIGWLITGALIWWVLHHAAQAGADVSGFFHWVGWAGGQFMTFVSRSVSGG